MAESGPFAAAEAQIAQVNSQFNEVIGTFQLSSDSRPTFAESTLECFGQALSKTTEALDSYRQRLATRDEREIQLEQGEKNIEEKEKLLAEETTKRPERDQRSEEKAAELKRWEERLAERESDVTKREKLLIERTRAVDRREITIHRLVEDARTELKRLSEARNTLDERKETIVAAEGRQAADEQALERWQDFLQQKHDNVIALNETLNEDALERQRKEKARKRIEEGDEWMEELEMIFGPMDRERRVNETVDLLHRLVRAKDRGDEEAITEVEDEIAEVDWEILEAAIAKADELAARVRARLAVTADTERAVLGSSTPNHCHP